MSANTTRPTLRVRVVSRAGLPSVEASYTPSTGPETTPATASWNAASVVPLRRRHRLDGEHAAHVDMGLLFLRVGAPPLIYTLFIGEAPPQYSPPLDVVTDRVVFRSIEGEFPVGVRQSADVGDKPSDRLDLREATDTFDSRVVVAVPSFGVWTRPRRVDHHAVVIVERLRAKPIKAARGAAGSRERGTDHREAQTGQDRQGHQRRPPPPPVSANPQRDRASHRSAPSGGHARLSSECRIATYRG